MWRELPRLRSVERFPAWADAILVNACRLVLRRRARARVRQVPLTDDQSAHGRPGADRTAARTTRLPIASCSSGRSLRCRSTRAQSSSSTTSKGRPVGAIAEALRIPAGTVKSRLFAARRDLERALERERR